MCPVVHADELPWGDATWVWDAAPSKVLRLRRTIELPAGVTSAQAMLTVDDDHRLFVNGKLVGEKKGWQSPAKYDLSKALVAGRNVVAIEGTDTGGSCGAIAAIRIVAGDKVVTIATDAQWKAAPAGAKDDLAWTAADFDDSKWPAATVLGPAGMGPWNILGPGGKPQPGPGVKPATAKPPAGDLPPAEQQKLFTIPAGYVVELIAAEPLVTNPVCMALDEYGRIYVAESHTYRYGKERSPVPNPTNPIVMLKPLADGKFERVVVADGFDDPVMGLVIRGGRMWASANNYLWMWDIDADGKATNRRLLLEDKGKAWNPFGFFVLKFGPDGLLYLSVGNHRIQIEGPNGQKITSRGSSGNVLRMNPDGTNIEVLVQGFRVPYTYDFDPFGTLWLMSNGEGMPNRFAKIIDAPAVDYHGYSRTNDADWLAGRTPLAPPAFELPRGANTSMLAYYGEAFPPDMWGNLLAVNWGPHGVGTQNHSIDRYVPDDRRNLYKPGEHWLTCGDPRFRPVTVLTAPDGNLLLCDFYNRDDESDATGRIWKIRYTGKDAIASVDKPATEDWSAEAFQIEMLSSRDHQRRQQAVQRLLERGDNAIPALERHAAAAKEPVGAAMALWTLARMHTPKSHSALFYGADHPDWQVRRLAAQIVRRFCEPMGNSIADELARDPDPAVRVSAALAYRDPAKQRAALVAALRGPTASDPVARYEAAWHLAQMATAEDIAGLLGADDENTRLAGQIVIDIASYEKSTALPAARDALAAALREPGRLDLERLLDLAAMSPEPAHVKPLWAIARRKDVPPSVLAKAVMLLLSLPPEPAESFAGVAEPALAGIRAGKIPVKSETDRIAVLRLMSLAKPTPFTIEQIAKFAAQGGESGRAANDLARSYAKNVPPELLQSLWKELSNAKTKADVRGDLLQTVSVLETKGDATRWAGLLTVDPKSSDTLFLRDAVRAWRRFAGQPEMIAVLVKAAPSLIEREPALKADLAVVLRQLGADVASLQLPAPHADLAALRADVEKSKPGHAQLGRQVFARAGCVQCHSAGEDARLGPPLAGIGQLTREYLIESLFEPSKVIKTGFETEVIETKDNRTLSGLVREAGEELIVVNANAEDRIPRSQVAGRRVQKLSIMPEGLPATLSVPEINDLIAYLQSLKASGKP